MYTLDECEIGGKSMAKIIDKIGYKIWEASFIPSKIALEIEDKIREQQDKKEQKKSIKSEITKTVIPTIVTDIKGLDKAVKAKEKVILVSNQNLFPRIKENVDKDRKFQNNTEKAVKVVKGGSIATIGGLVATGIGSVALFTAIGPTLVLGGIATTVVGAGTALVGGEVAIFNSLGGNLRNYNWIESDDKTLLILLKVKGENSYENENIDIENAKKYEE